MEDSNDNDKSDKDIVYALNDGDNMFVESSGESGEVDDAILDDQMKRLHLISPKHPSDITIDRLEEWTFNNHHRDVVHLLLCLAGSEVWCTSKTNIQGSQDRLMKAYKGWVAL